MKNIFSFLLIVCLSGCESKGLIDQYTLGELVFSPYLKLQVAPTFDHPVEYELTRHEPYQLRYTEYEGHGGYNWGKRSRVLVIELTEEQHTKAEEYIKSCLTNLPTNDEVFGMDGTTWLLESSVYQYIKVAVWSPEHDTAARGYSGLLELRDHLAKIVLNESQ